VHNLELTIHIEHKIENSSSFGIYIQARQTMRYVYMIRHQIVFQKNIIVYAGQDLMMVNSSPLFICYMKNYYTEKRCSSFQRLIKQNDC
jgi:uncharacterized protein YccT (UPF0319 family)